MAPARQVSLANIMILVIFHLETVFQLIFEIEENNRKEKISVEKYFLSHMKYKVRR